VNAYMHGNSHNSDKMNDLEIQKEALIQQLSFHNPQHHFASVNVIPSDAKQVVASNTSILNSQMLSKNQSVSSKSTTKTHLKASIKKVPPPATT